MNGNADPLPSLVRRRFSTLAFAGPLPLDSPGSVCVGEAGTEALGTRVRFELRIDRGRIVAVRFRAYGCPWTLATCDWLAEQLEQGGTARSPPGGPEAWAAALGVPLERLGRLLVIEDALRLAMSAAEIPEMARL